MKDNLPIVLGIVAVVVAVILYFVFAKKKELPAGEAKKDEKKLEAKPAAKAEAKAEAKAAKEPSVKTKAAAEALPSADVVTEESEREAESGGPAPAEAAPGFSKKDVAGLRKGLAATRGGFMARLKAIFTGKKEIDPAILADVEEVMITSDVGVKTTQAILERLRDRMNKKELTDADAVWAALRAEATRILSLPAASIPKEKKPLVVLMVGVNGVGKTTTIGKLATKWKDEGKKVLLAAGDTFRAAATEQLEEWAKRANVDIVKGKSGGDPSSVIFDAIKKGVDEKYDMVICDTAGRLHSNAGLMDELKKLRRVSDKAMPGAPHETWMVLDATTGQNAISQAKTFKADMEITGIVLTKLDGSSKGGVVLGICDELKVPVRFIGVGEKKEDLRPFDPSAFVEALYEDAGTASSDAA
jgi:fused signal recognition particle receptor